MSKIKGKDTRPEMLVRQFLHSQGFRYRLHDKGLPGKPDLSFRKYKTVVLVNGCFWHRHKNCPMSTTPSTNTEFWIEKFRRNQSRDLKNLGELQELGWKTIIVWECSLKKGRREKTLKRLASAIKNHMNQHIEL